MSGESIFWDPFVKLKLTEFTMKSAFEQELLSIIGKEEVDCRNKVISFAAEHNAAIQIFLNKHFEGFPLDLKWYKEKYWYYPDILDKHEITRKDIVHDGLNMIFFQQKYDVRLYELLDLESP